MTDYVMCDKCKNIVSDSEENYTSVSKSFDDHSDNEEKIVEHTVFVCKSCFTPE